MRKCLSLILAVVLSLSCALPASAMAKENCNIDIMECYALCVDESGEEIPVPYLNLSSHVIPAGGGMYYSNSNGSKFTLAAGSAVSVSLTLGSSSTVGIGYVSDTTGEVICKTVTSKTPSASFTIPSYGQYSIVVRNYSSGTVNVVSGTISTSG